MNPLFNRQKQNGPLNFMQQFNAFRQSFQGDPRQKVEELLQSGQMSQDQFNQLYSKASEIYQTMNGGQAQSQGNPFSRLFGM